MTGIKVSRLFQDFFQSEKSGGIILLTCAFISLGLANSGLSSEYIELWNEELFSHSIGHWINDGLMAIFFLLIGLELKREIYMGELSTLKNAMLPISAALGGMLLPASIHLLFNFGSKTQAGAGIPMATDIAFALGMLSLLGSRVPLSLKIFLTALAVIDDLGAILTIAVFYAQGLSILNLTIALSIFVLLGVLNRLKIRNLIPYLIGGVAMWYFMLQSGVHATISGVLLAFAIPSGNGDEKSTSYLLQQFLHKPVSFVILPIFALANTSIMLGPSAAEELFSSNTLGIFLGLFIGKPLGILLFSFIAVSLGISAKPDDLKWTHIAGLGLLGGIGFTMSIFVAILAFGDSAIVDASKIAIMVTSSLAACAGLAVLHFTLRKQITHSPG